METSVTYGVFPVTLLWMKWLTLVSGTMESASTVWPEDVSLAKTVFVTVVQVLTLLTTWAKL